MPSSPVTKSRDETNTQFPTHTHTPHTPGGAGDDSKLSSTKLVLTGTGCMLAYISLLQYFEGSPTFYVLISTLRRGAPRVARFLAGVMPVLLGYALFVRTADGLTVWNCRGCNVM
jgi:hypothetical protein